MAPSIVNSRHGKRRASYRPCFRHSLPLLTTTTFFSSIPCFSLIPAITTSTTVGTRSTTAVTLPKLSRSQLLPVSHPSSFFVRGKGKTSAASLKKTTKITQKSSLLFESQSRSFLDPPSFARRSESQGAKASLTPAGFHYRSCFYSSSRALPMASFSSMSHSANNPIEEGNDDGENTNYNEPRADSKKGNENKNYIDKLALLLINSQNQQLVARSFGKSVYFTPGGKRDHDDESDMDALCRECREELSVNLRSFLDDDHIGSDNNYHDGNFGDSDNDTSSKQSTKKPHDIHTNDRDGGKLRHFGTFEAQAYGKPQGTMVRITCFRVYPRAVELELVKSITRPSMEVEELKWIDSSFDRDKLTVTGIMLLEDLKEKGLIE